MEGINHTQIANEFLDNYMAICTGAEVKVFLAISRKTIGWHKETDKISLSLLETMTGLSNRHLVRAIKSLEEKELIRAEKSKGRTTIYELNYCQLLTKGHRTPDKRSQVKAQTTDKRSHTKESIKETRKESDLFNRIKDYFIDINPNYYHNGKQAKHIKNLITWSNSSFDKMMSLFDKHLKIKQVEKMDKFWVNSPHEPSTIYGKLSQILEYSFAGGAEKSYTKEDRAEMEKKRQDAFNNFKMW